MSFHSINGALYTCLEHLYNCPVGVESVTDMFIMTFGMKYCYLHVVKKRILDSFHLNKNFDIYLVMKML